MNQLIELQGFQWKVILLLLSDVKNLYQINLLSEDYFDDITLPVFQEIKRLFLLGKTFDIDYLEQVTGIKIPDIDCDSSMFTEYVNVLKNHTDQVRVGEFIDAFNSGHIKDIRHGIQELSEKLLYGTGEEFINRNRVREVVEELSVAKELTDTIKTKVDGLDNIINGFFPGDLDIIAGRPSMGKSAFVLQVLLNHSYHERKPSLYFSLEDTEDKVIRRALSHITGISFSKIINNRLDDADKKIIYDVVDDFNSAPLYILEQSKDIYQIVSDIRKLKLVERDLGLVAVDYIQLITPDYKKRPFDNVTQFTGTLKRTAKDLKLSMLALSQLSRKCEERDDKRPILSDLRESGSLEQEASRVLFLFRIYQYTRAEADRHLCEYILAKNKHGEARTVRGSAYMECFQFGG